MNNATLNAATATRTATYGYIREQRDTGTQAGRKFSSRELTAGRLAGGPDAQSATHQSHWMVKV
eukprot:scaffold115235_cov70-Cyclotella_meneghiniana.AAC.13